MWSTELFMKPPTDDLTIFYNHGTNKGIGIHITLPTFGQL
jgi:hypothetical protein